MRPMAGAIEDTTVIPIIGEDYRMTQWHIMLGDTNDLLHE